MDNGPAYRSDAFLGHARALGLAVEHIQVQTPEDNGVKPKQRLGWRTPREYRQEVTASAK